MIFHSTSLCWSQPKRSHYKEHSKSSLVEFELTSNIIVYWRRQLFSASSNSRPGQRSSAAARPRRSRWYRIAPSRTSAASFSAVDYVVCGVCSYTNALQWLLNFGAPTIYNRIGEGCGVVDGGFLSSHCSLLFLCFPCSARPRASMEDDIVFPLPILLRLSGRPSEPPSTRIDLFHRQNLRVRMLSL